VGSCAESASTGTDARLVEALLEREFRVYAVNPKQLDRFRDRFTVAGAKDDRRDAQVLGDSLRTDRHCFRRFAAEDAVVIELREWSRMTEDLQQERNRLANRMREQLWRYYPQTLAISDDLAADWFLELWAAIPTLQISLCIPCPQAKNREIGGFRPRTIVKISFLIRRLLGQFPERRTGKYFSGTGG
jgi:transposase